MEYWYSEKLAKLERIESEILGKHPEKLFNLEQQGIVRVNGEDDLSAYKKKVKKKKKK